MLSLHLGISLDTILDMPFSIFQLYKAYYLLEPFGSVRDNIHSASICSILANIHRKENSRPFDVKDFLFFQEEETPKNSLENLRCWLISQARMAK